MLEINLLHFWRCSSLLADGWRYDCNLWHSTAFILGVGHSILASSSSDYICCLESSGLQYICMSLLAVGLEC